MRRVILFFLVSQVSLTIYSQIVADHTVVDRYDDIPIYYMNEVKKMLFVYPGESHSAAIRDGLEVLETINNNYEVNTTIAGGYEAYTDQYLRSCKALWGDLTHATGWEWAHGEEDWYTNSIAISRIKAAITYANVTYGVPITAMGYGWCSDMVEGNSTLNVDPVYGCHWYGFSVGGPEGDLPIGIDANDTDLTGNSVCIDTYLSATQEYIDYCTANGIPQKYFLLLVQ